MISQTELARRLRVSQTAVSAALRHREKELRLDPALAERIRALAHRVGYRPNILARSLAQRRTHTLGVVVSDFSDPTFGSLLNHLQRQASRSGHELVVTGCGDDVAETLRIWERLLQRRVDAALWIDRPPHVTLSRLKRLWKLGGLRVIGIGTAFRKAGIPAVVFDSRDAVRQLARIIPPLRKSPIVFVRSHPDGEFSEWRWECVRQTWGGQCVEVDCRNGLDFQQIARLRTSGGPLPILGDQDLTSLKILHLLLTSGWLPRRDFLLGSFDGLPWLQELKPALTSVAQPLEMMARRAIQLALQPGLKNELSSVCGKLIRGETI